MIAFAWEEKNRLYIKRFTLTRTIQSQQLFSVDCHCPTIITRLKKCNEI